MSLSGVPDVPSQAASARQFPFNTAYSASNGAPPVSSWASKYRGATIQDLDPPPALSTTPETPISSALLLAYERDFSHLTVLHPSTRSLLGYLSIPRLRSLLSSGTVKEDDPVKKAMQRFRRKGRKYKVITIDTELQELEDFFEGRTDAGSSEESSDGAAQGRKQDFAVITDGAKKFVLGVVTRGDLEEFVKRRPG